jgi:hypothetical protein
VRKERSATAAETLPVTGGGETIEPLNPEKTTDIYEDHMA